MFATAKVGRQTKVEIMKEMEIPPKPSTGVGNCRIAVRCDCGDEACTGWMTLPGPHMLGGPSYRVPSGLTREQRRQFILDCATT
jgi:hypothetical protein